MSADEETKTILITVKLPNQENLQIKVKKETPMEKVFNAVATKLGVERKTLRFLFDGSPVQGAQTPKMLEMEEGDQIDCMVEQQGGGAATDVPALF